MIDWQRLTLNLRSAGLSCTAVAKKLDCHPGVVLRLARGESNRVEYETALFLLDLHEKLCPEKHDHIRKPQ